MSRLIRGPFQVLRGRSRVLARLPLAEMLLAWLLTAVPLTIGPLVAAPPAETGDAPRTAIDPLRLAAFLDEAGRVENFRQVERVFPVRVITRSPAPFEFTEQTVALPETYTFAGREQSLEDFFERTVTTGLLVLREDTICAERYFRGNSRESRNTSMSVAKSFVSALVGIALAQGKLGSLDQPASEVVTALSQGGYRGVPLRHLLTMSSGIRFSEEYDDPKSDIQQVMFGMASGASLADYVARLPRARDSGENFHYASVDTQVLGMAVEQATGQDLAAFLEAQLWHPLGMEYDASWATDNRGQVIAFAMLNATLRDYAKFGRLYLRGGNWQGRQIVPSQWVARSVAPERPELRLRDHYLPGWDIGYGYQWWIPAGNEGEFTGIGVWGQYLYVNPQRRVVIVKTSVDPEFSDRDPETIAVFRTLARAVAP